MQLVAEKRTEFGKKLNKIRNNFGVPGVIFGKGLESLPVTVDRNTFQKVYDASGETSLVDLKIGSDVSKVLIKEVQFHPVTSQILHVNFHKVNLKEKIEANIPVEISGDEDHPLIKSGEAILLQIMNEITIEALPTDLPDKFIVDVSGLQEVGDTVMLSELQYDTSKIELVNFDAEDDQPIVKLDYPMQEEVEETETSEEEALEKIQVTEEAPETEEENAGAGE